MEFGIISAKRLTIMLNCAIISREIAIEERINKVKYNMIAKLANVSASTVSKVMSGSSEISRETAELVLRIAKENNVEPPQYHKSRSTLRIAIIVPEIVSYYYSEMASAIIEELRLNEIEAFVYTCGFTRERYFDLLRRISDEQIADGIITFARDIYPLNYEIPMVAPSYCDKQDRFDAVYCDMESGIQDAVDYLVSLGHRDIGFISEKGTSRKLEYFKSAANNAGVALKLKNIFVSKKRFDDVGCEAAEYYANLSSPPTAIIAAYDEIALGAIRTFGKFGINIPGDISIIGINDIPSASTAPIPLTTIKTYSYEVTKTAVELLLNNIKNPREHISKQIKLKCELIIRDSSAKLCENA